MRLTTTLAAVCLLGTATVSAQSLETDKDKLSYALGYQIGTDFKFRNIDVNHRWQTPQKYDGEECHGDHFSVTDQFDPLHRPGQGCRFRALDCRDRRDIQRSCLVVVEV